MTREKRAGSDKTQKNQSMQRPHLSVCLNYSHDARPEVMLSSDLFVVWSQYPVLGLASPLHQPTTAAVGSS